MEVLILLAIWLAVWVLVFGSVGWWIAAQKSRSEVEGFALGSLLGPVGLIVEAMLPIGTAPDEATVPADPAGLTPGELPGDRRRPPSPIVALIVAAVAVVVVAVILVIPQGRETVVGGSPLLDKPAPEIDLATLDGEPVRLSDYRGRPVIVNFWATWCIPCRDEFPLLVAAYGAHRDAGLEILGVIHDDTVDGVRRFASDYGAEWPMLDDPQDVAWNDYLGVGVPMSFFIDREGVVRAFSIGGFTETGLAKQLERVLPAPSAPPTR